MTTTNGVFIDVGCLIDYGAHFRHGLNANDALDRKIGLVIDR